MRKERIVGALIGLAGAVNSNGKTETTDQVVREALLSEDSEKMVNRIHEEKFLISPNCRTCLSPCGNTSDYDTKKIEQDPENIRTLKLLVICRLSEVACSSEGELPELVYQAISYLGYDLQEEFYLDVLKKLEEAVRNNAEKKNATALK